MRIAYLSIEGNLTRSDGVAKKIATQIHAWLSEGHEVKFFAVSHVDDIQSAACELPSSIPVHVEFDTSVVGDGGNSLGIVRGIRRRLGKVNKVVVALTSWQPDLIYHRIHRCYPVLRRLQKRIPTVIEVNTHRRAEGRISLAKHKYLYQLLTDRQLFKTARGAVFVSDELARLGPGGLESIVIGNSINLSDYKSSPAPANRAPRLVFIGTGDAPWHGLEKLRCLASAIPSWRFDIIGYTQGDLSWIAPENMHFHGFLDRSHYEQIMMRADVGVGTLALHQKMMQEASPLKTREYLAYGLPTIIGYADTDFQGSHCYMLQLPNSPNNVADNLQTIESFVERVRGLRVRREWVAHLDVTTKEAQRTRFFQQCLGRA